MATRFPPSVAAKDNEEKGYSALADRMIDTFTNLGGWSTDPALKAYPESIRQNDLNCASFLPAYYRALTFLNSLQMEGMIDSVPSTKVTYSNVKNWMLAHLPPATLDAIPIAYQRKLFRKILLMIQSRIPFPRDIADLVKGSLKEDLLKITNLLSNDDISLIHSFILTTSFDICHGSFFPLDFATPKGAKLFSVVNVPSLELR
jgi:hypothetical protein